MSIMNGGLATLKREHKDCMALRWLLGLASLLGIVGLLSAPLKSQSYLTSTGSPGFAAPYPAEMGMVDAASGNLHLEIPLATFSQRATGALVPKLIYDSHIWTTKPSGEVAVWTTQGSLYGLAFGTWGFSEGGNSGLTELDQGGTNGCNDDYMLWSESGVQHFFNVAGTLVNGDQCSGGTTYATDSSGYMLIQSAWGSGLDATVSIYAPDGTQVYGTDLYSVGIASKDSNGNYLGLTYSTVAPPGIDNPVTDTLGRDIVTPIIDGNTITLEVTNAQGKTSNYVITTTTVTLNTDFQEPGVVECNNTDNCTATVISSVSLPDGTSYSFLYDCLSGSNPVCNAPSGQSAYYGTLTSMSVPTGETITYGYTLFSGLPWGSNTQGVFPSYWLTSKSSSQGTWTYTPTVTGGIGPDNLCQPGYQVGCIQTTVQRPDGSKDVDAFIADPYGGSWPQSILSYDTDGATLLSTVGNAWNFSTACTLNLCEGYGYQDVQKLRTSTTVPIPGANLTKQTTYTYDSPQTGNITSVKEWKYQSGTSPSFPSTPDRATYISYATIKNCSNCVQPVNIIDRPATITICNNAGTSTNCPGGGSTLAQTAITYDSYSGGACTSGLGSVTGAANHDDTNYGCSWTGRGNPTTVMQWVSATSSLTTSYNYDTTGQITTSKDSAGNVTSYLYAPDNFYSDTGSDSLTAYTPAKPTNAYVVKTEDNIGTTTAGYYYGSGQTAYSTDYSGKTTYSHYMDPFDRLTDTDYPIGWVLNQYGLPIQGQTEIDSYMPVGDTAGASSSCTNCAHSQSLLDPAGRVTTDSLVNNPSDPVYVEYGYDSVNRVVTTTHPNFGTSDPNDVIETEYYDGLSRSVAVLHPDGESSRTTYGAKVANVGGVTTQQSSTSTYGYGYPIASLDEAGKQRQEWIDGFGHVIEVDEPSGSGSPGTGSVAISGSEQEGDSGTVSITVNGQTASAPYGEDSTDASIASALAEGLGGAISSVTASASEGVVKITATAPGTNTNYSLSATSQSSITGGAGSFTATASGSSLTGGTGGISSSPTVTTYTYNAVGNLTSVIQGSQTRTWQYDGLSRLTNEVTPEAGTITLSYLNSSGSPCSGNPANPCSRTAPAPNQTGTSTVTTTYTYDDANRLTKKAYSDNSSTVTYTYATAGNAVGFLATISDASGGESYNYNTMKQVTKLSKRVGSTVYAITYTYNPAGEVTSITYPSGRVVYYNYDAVGHLCQVAAASSTSCNASPAYLTLPSAQYDAAGRPLSATYGNGIAASATYDPNSFALTTLNYKNGSTVLLGLNYYYQQNSTYCPTGNAIGNNGQIQCIADVSSGTGDSGRSAAYTYDALGRLLTAKTTGSTQFPAWGLSETYDRYSNRSAQAVTAGSGYNASFSINAVNNQITSFTYDAAGNVISVPSPTTTYTYDHEECNTGFNDGSSNATYTCDANGLRVEKVVTGTDAVSTVYIRSGGQVIAEYDNGAAVTSPTREYLYGNNLLAIVTGSTSGSGGTIVYQHRDHLSPRLYTDVNGNCVGDQGTYPFGELWYSNGDSNCTNTASSSFIYTSYERDAESGNDYALARSYASTQGRFLRPDPLEGIVGDPQSWNRYAYVENDPINLSDPSGQGFWEDLGFAIADIFAAIFLPEALPEMTATEGGAAAANCAEDCVLIWQAIKGGFIVAAIHGVGVATGGGTSGPPNFPPSSSPMPTCGGCDNASVGDGGPGAGNTDPGQTGASGQGPGGSGQGVGAPGSWGAGGADTIPGSTLPNGDRAVGMDIWHNHAGCEGCGDLWGHAARTMNTVTKVYGIAFGSVMGGAVAALSGPTLGGSGALLDPLVANSEKVLVQTEPYHKFGELVGRQAMQYGEQAVQNGWYRQWNISGFVNGARGVFQYGGTLSPLGTVVYITHTFFQRF
jgi:RHS repeat-associated protein